MDFLNKLAALAEEQGHHPDVALTGYRNVTVTLFTFSIGGLHDNDFILGETPHFLFLIVVSEHGADCTGTVCAAAKSDSIEVDYSPKYLKENPNVTAGIPR